MFLSLSLELLDLYITMAVILSQYRVSVPPSLKTNSSKNRYKKRCWFGPRKMWHKLFLYEIFIHCEVWIAHRIHIWSKYNNGKHPANRMVLKNLEWVASRKSFVLDFIYGPDITLCLSTNSMSDPIVINSTGKFFLQMITFSVSYIIYLTTLLMD